jgi:hypothetical protein
MEDIIQQFEKDFKAWLENKYILSGEPDQVKKLNDIEKASEEYVDRYLLQTNLIAGDLALSVQHVLDEFIRTKMK